MEFNTHHTESCMGWPWLVFFDTEQNLRIFPCPYYLGIQIHSKIMLDFCYLEKKKLKKKGKKKIMKESKTNKIKMISKGKFRHKHMYIQYDFKYVKTNNIQKQVIKMFNTGFEHG